MKDTYQVTVACPACGQKNPFQMVTLIDTARDANAERKVLSSEYFTHVCPRCHSVQPISYSCMYHDGKRKLLIGWADTEQDYLQMRQSLGGKIEEDKLDEALNRWLKTCSVRLVRNEYELQEKVLIAHFDLDDRVIEIAREKLREEIAEEYPALERILFNTKENHLVFLLLTDEGIVDSIPLPQEKYDEFAAEYANILVDDSEIEVGRAWAEKILIA